MFLPHPLASYISTGRAEGLESLWGLGLPRARPTPCLVFSFAPGEADIMWDVIPQTRGIGTAGFQEPALPLLTTASPDENVN